MEPAHHSFPGWTLLEVSGAPGPRATSQMPTSRFPAETTWCCWAEQIVSVQTSSAVWASLDGSCIDSPADTRTILLEQDLQAGPGWITGAGRDIPCQCSTAAPPPPTYVQVWGRACMLPSLTQQGQELATFQRVSALGIQTFLPPLPLLHLRGSDQSEKRRLTGFMEAQWCRKPGETQLAISQSTKT